jgi:ligand-binding SRPBCC domain-containing protein
MTTIRATNLIHAPIEICFRFSRSIDLELRAANKYGIRAIDGVTNGLIGPGDRVTWRTKQFCVTVEHTTEITGFREPEYFQDSMVHGLFASFHHNHFFRVISSSETEMRDELHFTMPQRLAGRIGEAMISRRRLTALLERRNALIKKEAELAAIGIEQECQ